MKLMKDQVDVVRMILDMKNDPDQGKVVKTLYETYLVLAEETKTLIEDLHSDQVPPPLVDIEPESPVMVEDPNKESRDHPKHLSFVKTTLMNCDDKEKMKYILLKSACEEGHLDVVKYLVQNGANIRANDDWVLNIASEHGHLEIVKYLVDGVFEGADVLSRQCLALREAVENGHSDIVKFLIEKGADVHIWEDMPLKWASERGNLDLVSS